MKTLPKEELARRLQEGRNYKKLHATARVRIEKQAVEIKELRTENAWLRKELETLRLELEELKRMLFKKKKKDDDHDTKGPFLVSTKKDHVQKVIRSKDSYQRTVPTAEEVTEHVHHTLSVCPDCQTILTKKKEVVFYMEDIPLPTPQHSLKQVHAHHITQGYCTTCKKWKNAIPLPSTRVALGKKIRLYVCYLSLLLRCSFEQIRHLLRDTYGFLISDGEIRNILFQMAEQIQQEYHHIWNRLQQGSGVQMDETGGGQKTYVWIMTAIEGADTIFLAGRSRGGGNAWELLGNDFSAPRVSDCFAAYINLPGQLAYCWAHPFRKLRDLAESQTLSKQLHQHVLRAYETFDSCYTLLEKTKKTPYEKVKWNNTKEILRAKLVKFALPHKKDPKKLQNIRLQFSKDLTPWLRCLDYPHIPADNNKAERGLRHIVLKRKISFGNKSEQGYQAFAINISVFLTYWNTYKENFFSQFQLLLQGV